MNNHNKSSLLKTQISQYIFKYYFLDEEGQWNHDYKYIEVLDLMNIEKFFYYLNNYLIN